MADTDRTGDDMQNRSGTPATLTAPLSAIPACPVAPGDRVRTDMSTAGEVVRIWWRDPGPSPLVPTRLVPGYWLAVVWEDAGVAEPGEMPYDAARLLRETSR